MTVTDNKIIASEGMTLTNGEAFGKVVYLASEDDCSNWHEITDEEAVTRKQAMEDAVKEHDKQELYNLKH